MKGGFIMQELASTKNNYSSTELLVRISLLTALSIIGSYIKFPGPVGSIALDSLSGYLAVILIGTGAGSLVLILGHLLSALTAGFVLGPIHLLIAVIMGSCGLVFSYLIKKNIYLAVIITTLINGIGAAALMVPFFGAAFFYTTAPVLTIASFANIALAVIISKLLKNKAGKF